MWITFSSIILAFSFVFSKSIGDMYAAVIFLFVVHPFDVGDALMIGSSMTGSALNQLVWVCPCIQACFKMVASSLHRAHRLTLYSQLRPASQTTVRWLHIGLTQSFVCSSALA